MLYGSPLKEMDDVPVFMNFHPMMTMLTEDELAISSNVNISEQCAVNITSWLMEQ